MVIPIIIVLIGLSFQRKLKHPEQLAVDRGSIWYRYWRKGGGWITRRVPISSIRQILVKRDPTHIRTNPDIVIEGVNEEIRFGWWLPRESKIRVKDLLLSLIAEEQ
jgi:hypothetical protein